MTNYDLNKFEAYKEYLGESHRYYVIAKMSKEFAFQLRQLLAVARAHPEIIGVYGEDTIDKIEEELREVT